MAKVELIMPKMGESVSEATIIGWTKEVGDIIEVDETIIEIATDKVDSEVPSTHNGKLVEKLFQEDDVVQVGQPFAILESEEEGEDTVSNSQETIDPTPEPEQPKVEENITTQANIDTTPIKSSKDRFYSPLVKSMAKSEGITANELDSINGTGKEGRVTKTDMLSYLETRKEPTAPVIEEQKVDTPIKEVPVQKPSPTPSPAPIQNTGDTEIIEMDRMRKLISAHMTMSKQTSAHITSFVEADMTNIVNWRNKIKEDFKQREGQNITFTPIIIEAMAKAVKDFPMINVSVNGTEIHIHKNVNVGMATALPDGNLIVPVIKKCQEKNLVGITKSVNDRIR